MLLADDVILGPGDLGFLRRTFGVRAGRLDLTVLDNTSPAAVEAVVGPVISRCQPRDRFA